MDFKESNAEKPSQYYATESRGEAPYTKRKSDTVRRRSLKGLRRELYESSSTPYPSPYSNTHNQSSTLDSSPQLLPLPLSTESSNDSTLNQIPSLSHPCPSQSQPLETSPTPNANEDETEIQQTMSSFHTQYITEAELTNHLDQHYERTRVLLEQFAHAADQRFTNLGNRIVHSVMKIFHDVACRSNLPAPARAAFIAEIQAVACNREQHDCNGPNAGNESIEQISDEFSEEDEAEH